MCLEYYKQTNKGTTETNLIGRSTSNKFVAEMSLVGLTVLVLNTVMVSVAQHTLQQKRYTLL